MDTTVHAGLIYKCVPTGNDRGRRAFDEIPFVTDEGAGGETGRVPRSEQGNRAAMRPAAVDGIAAYLAGEDADLYNITDAAVQEDVSGAAWNLTALAAAAVHGPRQHDGPHLQDVLRPIDESGLGEFLAPAAARQT